MIIGTLILSTLYFLLIYFFYRDWKSYSSLSDISHQMPVAVIIPARNEAANIKLLLEDLSKQNYPIELLEIIVVDDHSEDKTPIIVQQMEMKNVRLLYLRHFLDTDADFIPYKKKALETGIKSAKNELIITTDADCRVGPDWISSMAAAFAEEKIKIAAGPVVLYQEKNILQYFQSLDLVGLMGITAATTGNKHVGLCNGANLAYRKNIFNEVDGFREIDHLPSGDDMLLMKKILKKYPRSAAFVKNKKAIVRSLPAENLQALLNQRIRWVSKVKVGNFLPVTLLLTAVYIFHLLIITLFFLSIFEVNFVPLLLIALACKIVPEYLLIRSTSDFFEKKVAMNYFIPAEFIHILYILLIGILGIFAQYEWKGRKIN